MAISTNSVIHYTELLEDLKGIITCHGFRIKYCIEEIKLQNPTPLNAAFPMVSFCDIPLSGIKNHIETYGSYGIGLSKTWAKRSGLNPVHYIERESRFAESLHEQTKRIYLLAGSVHEDRTLAMEFARQLAYKKNYEGRLVRGKINTDSYRFYDEREWRFCALEADINGEPMFIIGSTYLLDKTSFNDKIKDCYLKFSHEDISYLIVDNEDEIPELLKTLNDVYEGIITSKDLKILSTKILTKQQIWNDF
ncbi:MAG: hypothetical protein IPO62_04690 [Saprospiraceae bacterium]|nr:hypothetical protein [Saprospiraceae bacterium]